MNKYGALGGVLGLMLGCNGAGVESEESADEWDASWVVGPVFEGVYGLTVGENNGVWYLVLYEDGSVQRGLTVECEPGEPSAFGTWTQTAADEVEIRFDGESWPGNPALDFVRLEQGEDCPLLEAHEIQTDGTVSGKGLHYYTRARPCLSHCDGTDNRAIIACEGEVNPCD